MYLSIIYYAIYGVVTEKAKPKSPFLCPSLFLFRTSAEKRREIDSPGDKSNTGDGAPGKKLDLDLLVHSSISECEAYTNNL